MLDSKAFLAHMAQIFDVPENEMTMNYVLADGEWDSLASMATMAGIDKFYNVVVPVKEIAKCRTLSDLMKLIEATLGESE